MIALSLSQTLGLSLAALLVGLCIGVFLGVVLVGAYRAHQRERATSSADVPDSRQFRVLGDISPSFPARAPELWVRLLGAPTVGAVPSVPFVLAYDSADPAAILVLHREQLAGGARPVSEFVLSRELLSQTLSSGTGEWAAPAALGPLSHTRLARLIGPECDLVMIEYSPGAWDELFQVWVPAELLGEFLARTLLLVGPSRERELLDLALSRLERELGLGS